MTIDVGEYVDYLYGRGLSEKTVAIYVSHIKRIVVAGIDPDTMTATECATYASTTPASAATRRQLRCALTRYWEATGRRDGPIQAIRVPPKPRGVCRALPQDDARLLVKAARGWRPEGLAVMFGMFMALRREEIATARWDRFDQNLEWYTVTGKGDVTATIPVHPALRNELEPTGCVWLFPGRINAHVTPATIWQWVMIVADAAGIGHVTTHQLRHTAIATANDNTGDLRATSEFARHRRIETTMIYTRTTADRLKAVTESINYD